MNPASVNCPTCAAPFGHGCIALDGSAPNLTLPYFHAARVEAAAFAAGIDANPKDLSPITDEAIERTGLI